MGGLKIGDQLISVNGVFVEGQRRELANELLKMNSSVKLVVRPKGKTNFSVISKNQKKDEDPRLAYLKNIPQKHVEKIENEIMETLANVSWDEICGLQFVKGTIREIVILPFLRPDIFNGILQPPTGLLLFGPPGNSLHFLKYRVTSFDVFLFEIVCFVNFKDWTKMQK